jgi:hypothetical protein
LDAPLVTIKFVQALAKGSHIANAEMSKSVKNLRFIFVLFVLRNKHTIFLINFPFAYKNIYYSIKSWNPKYSKSCKFSGNFRTLIMRILILFLKLLKISPQLYFKNNLIF